MTGGGVQRPWANEPLGRREGSNEERKPTTLSTIAVQSGTTRIVIALLQNKEWVELKALEMTPELSHLAPSLEQALLLQQQHDDVLRKLASKESPVEDLLNQADHLISGQGDKAAAYSAMADSLAVAWRDLNRQLDLRRQVLVQCVRYHRRSQNFSDIMDLADGVFGDVVIPGSPEAAQKAIRRLLDVRKGVLEASMLTLQDGNVLLEKLRLLATRGTVDSRPNQIRNAVQTACVQVERWMEDLHDRRRCVDVLFTNRRLILDQCLSLAIFYADLGSLKERAERCKRELNSSCELGESASSADILLYQHSKLEVEAKAVQDAGLQQLRAAEELVRSATYARDQPRTAAYGVLELCSDLVSGAERRRGLLSDTAQFFTVAQHASDRLLSLEGDLQAAPARDEAVVHAQVSASLEEAVQPALKQGQRLLDDGGEDGTEGIQRAMEALRRRLEALQARCRVHEQRRQQRARACSEYTAKYTLIFGWLENVGDSFLRTHTDLGQALAPAAQFVTLHEQLHGDVTAKGDEVDSLLQSVPELCRKLDRRTAVDLAQKAEDLRAQWTTLQQLIEMRLDVARPYARFHQQVEGVRASLDELGAALAESPLTDERLHLVEDKWLTMQQQYHQLAAVGQRFLEKTKQCRDPYLKLPPARACVEALLRQLEAAHLTVTESYEQAQLRTTTIKRLHRQWERCQRDVRKIEESVVILEAELYPILRESGLSLSQRSRQCEDRAEGVLPMLRQAHSELDQMAQTALKLSRKGDAAGDAERLAEQLTVKSRGLAEHVEDYEATLQMMASYFRKLKDVNSRVLQRRSLDASRQLPRETEECQQALKEHEAIQQAFRELFKLTGEELERTCDKIRQVEPPAAADHDILQLREALDREMTNWTDSQTSRKEQLEKQVTSTVFNSELNAINSQLTELRRQLSQARGHYSDSLKEAEQTKQAFRTFEETIASTGQQIERFVQTAQDYMGTAAPRPEAAVSQLEELQLKWSTFQQQVADNRRLTDLAIRYLRLLEQAEDWYKIGGGLLVDVARRSTQIRAPEDAHALRAEIGDLLSPGEREQRRRLDEATDVARELYGEETPRRLASVVQQTQEMVDSFRAIQQHLLTLVNSLEQAERERDTLKREKDQLSASMTAAREEVEVARSAAAASDEARRAAEAAAHALEEMPRPISPLEEQPTQKVDASTQDASSWQETIIRESTITQQMSPPKRLRKDDAPPPPVAPIFTEPLMDQTVQDSVRHTLHVRVSGVPAPTVSWQKNGLPCDNNPDYAIALDRGLCTLTIEETLLEDSGIFTCRAWNMAGAAETRGRLTVKDSAPEDELAPPVFSHRLSDSRVREGQARLLAATVTGNPLPVVTWSRDSVCVDASDDYVITYNNGECTLRVGDAAPRHRGTYTCQATNVMGTDLTSAHLEILPRMPTEAPRFTTPLSNVMARAGQKLRLECVVRGLPHPDITWLHDQKPVRPDSKVTFDGRRATLTIPEAFPKDAGAYVVVAKNAAGQATCSCNVSVKGRLPTETSDSELASDMEPVKPTIPAKLRDLTVHSGQPAQLDCIITGQPEPEVIWYHGEQPVKESKEFQLLFHGDRCTLVINSALPDDAGTYSVVAINSAGEASSSCHLHVLSEDARAADRPPKFSRLLSDVIAAEGQPQVLDAEVSGCPEPLVIWLKDGREVKSSESMKLSRVGGNCRLEIGASLPEHGGTYMCVASNAAGEARSFSHVTVVAPLPPTPPPAEGRTLSLRRRRPPTFVQIFTDQAAADGQQVRFECVIDARPAPTVEWLFDDSALLPHQFSTSSEGKRHVLTVTSTELVPSGQVKCVAENNIGKATCAAYLTVGELPDDSFSDTEQPRRSSVTKTTITETHQQTRVTNGDGYPSPRTADKQNDESHSGVAGGFDREVRRTTIEQSCRQASRSPMARDDEGADGDRPARPPKFTAPLQGIVVDEGEDVLMTGEYTGNPVITWLKDAVELSADCRAVTSSDDTTVTLTLQQATEQDSGRYTCILQNAAGTSKSTAELLVRKILTAPVFDHRLKAQVTQPGQPAVMEVVVSGIPPPEVIWSKDGQPITNGQIEITQEDGRHVLTILNVTHGDTGKYAVCAKNDAGETTSIADFVVTDEMPTIIERKVTSTDVTDGQMAQGSGTSTGQEIVETSVCSMSWRAEMDSQRRRSGAPSAEAPVEPPGGRHHHRQGARRSESPVEPSPPSETANSTTTTTRYESLERRATRVTRTQESRQLSHQVTSQSLQERRDCRLSDIFGGGGRPDSSRDSGHRLESPRGSPLRQEPATEPPPAAAGRQHDHYTSSERQFTTRLAVKLSEERQSPPFGEARESPDRAGDGRRPGVVSRSCREERSVRSSTSCSSSGTAPGSESDGRLAHSKSRSWSPPVVPEPARANGQPPTTDSRLRNYAPSALLRPPVLLKPLSDVYLQRGQELHLRLIVDALPQPTVSWYRDDCHLAALPRTAYRVAADNGVCTLTLQHVYPEDAGLYRCEATNHMGTVSSEALVCVAGEKWSAP